MVPRTTKASATSLPRFIPPMLAKPGSAFDSEQHLFEVKWDGTRTLAFVEKKQYRLVNRRQIDMTDRYPDLGCLASFPSGTVLDGEMVVLRDGKPDFGMLQSREQARSPLKIKSLAQALPATYIVFDLLYADFQSLVGLPLIERRQRLEALLNTAGQPQVVLSQGIIGPGRAFFEETCRQGLEGVMAKRLKSRYLPGKRTDAWLKIKRQTELLCVILGFLPVGTNDFRSLILAAEDGGTLRCVGKVGSGFSADLRKRLNHMLWTRLQARPLVPCKLKGKWIKPGLYCRVSCMERTARGDLRAPVFKELIEG